MSEIAFNDTVTDTYLDLDDHPQFEQAATLLLQNNLIMEHPVYRRKVRFGIFD